MYVSFFFFNDTATTEIYTLSLHDALPISAVPYRNRGIGASVADLERDRFCLSLTARTSCLRWGRESLHLSTATSTSEARVVSAAQKHRRPRAGGLESTAASLAPTPQGKTIDNGDESHGKSLPRRSTTSFGSVFGGFVRYLPKNTR